MTSDPMGPSPGRIYLNGNAENPERFISLAAPALGESEHRDAAARARNVALIITAAWGPGEAGDLPLRRRLKKLGHEVDNLGLYRAFRVFLHEREVVRTVYEEHEAVWRGLYESYSAENDATVAQMRAAWGRAKERFPDVTMDSLLRKGDARRAGPRTRPVATFLREAWAGQMQRAVGELIEADERQSSTLGSLWRHFHLAAGVEFDPLWQRLRAELVEKILSASTILLAGGSPSLLLVALRFFSLESVLNEALRRGTNLFGSSAGAMVLQRRVVVFNDRGVPRQEFQLLENGMRLIEGLQIFPHCEDRVQTDDPANLAYLAARFRHRAAIGLNAGSVLELVPDGGRWRGRSTGDEDVVVFGIDGQKHRYAGGDAIPELA